MSDERAVKPRGRAIAALASLCVTAGLLSACGSSLAGSPPASSATTLDPPTPTSGAGPASEVLANAKASVAQLIDPASAAFNYSEYIPTTKVVPKKGATIAIIGAALSSPVVKQYCDAVLTAARLAGFEGTEMDGQFNVATMASLVQQAVQQKYAGIVLVGVVPDTVASPLAAAQSAGIPVVAFDGYGDTDNGVTDVGVDPVAVGKAVGDWIIADSDGKANVLATTFSSGASGGPKSVTNVAELALISTLKQCTGCTVKVLDTTITDVVAPGSPQYVSALRSYPKGSIDYVASGCDTCMINYGILDSQLGLNGIKVTGGYATSVPGVAAIKAGTDGASAAPVNPADLIGLLTVDTLARRLAGQAAVNAIQIPCPLVVQSNANDFPQASYDPPTDYRQVFASLWSVTS